jgi:arachidonate 15-lipoxygenase
VQRYYANDADVTGDVELAAWVAELGAQAGGRLVGVDKPTSVASLGDLVAIVIWTGSAQHSAVNFPQFPFMGVMPNTVGALWDQWPTPGVPDDATTHLKLLPPYDMSVLQLNTVYQLSEMRMNKLGHYGMLHFLDGRVRELVSDFVKELEAAEKVIAARDKSRFLSYPYLLPSTIPASIHI